MGRRLTDECVAVLEAHDAYADVRDVRRRPVVAVVELATLEGRIWRAQVPLEWVKQPIWAKWGRLYFRCSGCRVRCSRLYVPAVGDEPRCRRCWNVAYLSQSYSYRGTLPQFGHRRIWSSQDLVDSS